MKICLNTSSFPKYNGDYAGAFVLDLATELHKMGHDVWVLCPAVDSIKAEAEINGVHIIRYRYAFPAGYQLIGGNKPTVPMIKEKPLLLFFVPFYIISQFFTLINVIRRHKIEVVNSHWIVPQGLLSALICWIFRVKHVITMHSTDVYLAGKIPFGRTLCRMADKKAAAVFIVSEFVKQRYDAILGRTSAANVIPMGVNDEKFHPHGEVKRDYNKILFVGRLHKIKGIDNLIRAIAVISKEIPSVKLEIAGGGEEKESLEKLVDELALRENVSFAGMVPNNELVHHYNSARCVAVPSLHLPSGETEGMPVVIIESMACGIPVIASDVGGISDIVQDGYNGFLFRHGSPEEIAEAIKKIFDSDIDKISANAFETGARFHWEKVAHAYEKAMIG